MNQNAFSPETERFLQDYRKDIARYLEAKGPNTYNLISLTLRIIAKAFGPRAYIQTIREFKLMKKFPPHAKRTI